MTRLTRKMSETGEEDDETGEEDDEGVKDVVRNRYFRIAVKDGSRTKWVLAIHKGITPRWVRVRERYDYGSGNGSKSVGPSDKVGYTVRFPEECISGSEAGSSR